jgi:mannose-6-phosphate isomerase-like protein (cupin superfamily)
MKASIVAVQPLLSVGIGCGAPPNARHDIVNTGTEPLRIDTVYAASNPLDGCLHPAKVDAQKDNADEVFGAAVQ